MAESQDSVLPQGFQHTSVWGDEGDTSSPLLSPSKKSLSSSSHHSQGSAFTPTRTRVPTNSSKPNRRKSGEYELKNAKDALVGSIAAAINFLGDAGVPKPACEQLQKNLELEKHFAVLKRVQDYVHCIPSKSEDEASAKIHLAVTAWEALCRYKNIEYKLAYKYSFHLRYETKGASPQEIKQAIAVQVRLAEHCMTCQKKLYLVQNWQRRLLTKMNRSTVIEPQGYQPIRCL
eukprot:Nitzschia sp. Nitz4//scaffold5_size260463//235747//236442//NITZ4_001028-RA/size260463-processed-gene-0.151-mRNA-1//-1//CDS//3329555478//7872//frame0